MMKRNTENDNWGQLLSDFGIEDKKPEETVEPVASVEPLDSEVEVSTTSAAPPEKKSIFSRFPKINFFGVPPDVSLDSVIEEVKSPSLGGKAFTDNKLEKVPLSQEWANRREKGVAADSDALSAVASQIDALASGRDARTKPEGIEERPAKRRVSSMFDDPIPESEEERALKDIMGTPPRRDEPRRNTFHENETDSWQRGRGRQKPQTQENEVRSGRGSKYRPPVEENDLPESDFEPIEDDIPKTRERGRRGSRYAGNDYREREREPIRDDVPQEEWSEVDAALQAGRGEPTQRGGNRHQRYDKRRGTERAERERPAFDKEPSGIADSAIAAVHGNVPSWDEAVGDIIVTNIAKHKSYSGKGRR